ncbi:MAG TPA: response regulator [Calditrichia bacterium]|nr:response regulator [Calditrichia bacterium]
MMTAIQKHTILVVDDEPGVLELICESLQIQGFDAIGAANPEEALAQLPGSGPTFALLDLNLNWPGIDGIDLAREIQGIHPQTIIIIMTGYQNLKTSVEASRRHAYRYLIKPFQIDQLIGVMERSLWERDLLLENEALKKKVAALTSELQQLREELARRPEEGILRGEMDFSRINAGNLKAIQSYQRHKRVPLDKDPEEN